MPENVGLEPPERLARLHPQLLDQFVAGLGVHGQRVRLPTHPVQREHECPTQRLAQRVLADQRLNSGIAAAGLPAGDLGLEA